MLGLGKKVKEKFWNHKDICPLLHCSALLARNWILMQPQSSNGLMWSRTGKLGRQPNLCTALEAMDRVNFV